MAPLAARASSNDESAGGMPPFVIVAIVIAILLGGAALAAFLMFGNRTYCALIAWWKSRKTPAPSNPTIPVRHVSRGGATPPTASIPRFAHNLGTAMHLPLPKTSSAANRPMSIHRACPTGMGRFHTRRGSEASTNSATGLLPVSIPASPRPVFVRGGTATGQGMTR